MIDVLIQTHNEELNLPHTLQSVKGWVNKIFVVDSGSTDRTCELALEQGAIVVQKAWQGYARQKNWALSTLPFESDWILILDADECVTPKLKEEILHVASRPVQNVNQSGFYLNRVFIFMGREIRHCAYFPAWNLRLFKRGKALYEERDVHEHMIVDGPTGHLRNLLEHQDRRGLEHFIAKHNRYSTLEAMEIYRHREKWPGIWKILNDRVARRRYVKYCVAPKLALPWMLRFFYMYFIRGGILDRRPGLTLCLLISSYELFIRAKFNELVRTGGQTPNGISGLSVQEGGAATGGKLDAGVAPKFLSARPIAIQRTEEVAPSAKPIAISNASGIAAKASPAPLPVKPIKPAVSPVNRLRDHPSPWNPMENIKRALWMVVRASLFRFSFHNWYGWRRLVLTIFGAKLGRGVRIRPTASIEIPWNIDLADGVVVGDYAILYSLGLIKVGSGTTISQYAHLCAGTHDYTSRKFPLLKLPIVVGQEVWIAADAFIGPGVTIGDRAVVGARSTVVKDVPADQVAVGPGATVVKARILND